MVVGEDEDEEGLWRAAGPGPEGAGGGFLEGTQGAVEERGGGRGCGEEGEGDGLDVGGHLGGGEMWGLEKECFGGDVSYIMESCQILDSWRVAWLMLAWRHRHPCHGGRIHGRHRLR